MNFENQPAGLLDELVELRRDIHAHPELGRDLPETQRRILEALEGLPLEIHRGKSLSSITAVLHGDKEGPAVLIRSDMDALPLKETTGLSFASQEQRMHACGHDLHIAGLVGAAKLLSSAKNQLPGNVIFMFQPAEETLEGARAMIDEGVLEITGHRPVAAYATHVAPGPRGHFMLSAGPSSAGTSKLEIKLTGTGGHASRPHEAVDLVLVMAEITVALQTMVARKIDTQSPAIVTLTKVQAGTAHNIMPSSVTAEGTFRYLTEETKARLSSNIENVVTSIANLHGVQATTTISHGCPPLVNDEKLTEQSTRVLTDLFGATRVSRVSDSAAVMGGEDFAFISNEIPSSYFRLFATPSNIAYAAAAPNHSPNAIFDDSILADHATALAALAWDRLSQR